MRFAGHEKPLRSWRCKKWPAKHPERVMGDAFYGRKRACPSRGASMLGARE